MMASAKTLRGCTYGGCLRPAYDLQRCIDLYLGGHLKLDALVGRQLPLEQVNDAILDLESGAIGRSVIVLQ
jgi:Zn-dependent alcohol dehydrogenase